MTSKQVLIQKGHTLCSSSSLHSTRNRPDKNYRRRQFLISAPYPFPLLFSSRSHCSSMASPFSPTTPVRSVFHPKLNPPKAIIAVQARDSCLRVSGCVKCQMSSNFDVTSQRASYGFLALGDGALKFCGKPHVEISQKRRGVIRFATLEEIAEMKSSIESDIKERMEKAIETVQTNFNSIRTGRANPSILDRVEVEYYGSQVGLKTIAQISTPDASSILVQPYDKSSLKMIEKAIVSSGLGLNPNNDGDVLRLSIPPLTSDRRKELAKVVSKRAEEGKVAIRNIRKDGMKAYDKLKKDKKLSEDNVRDLSNDMQKLTDEYVKKVDTISKQKEKEVLTV